MVNNILLILLQFVLIIRNSSELDNVDQTYQEESANMYRLPNDTIPIHYNVRLNPEVSNFNDTFEGETQIDFKVRKVTSEIVLHSIKLMIDESATSITENENVSKVDIHVYDEITETVRLGLNESLRPGTYTLKMKFKGKLGNDLNGFFRSYYLKNNDYVPYLATHFQKTYARRAFPCWDEPAMKATFNVSLKHFDNFTALSNMPAFMMERDETDGKNWTHFETTPVMSTNILAFVISDFTHISNSNNDIKVWADEETIPNATYFMSIIEQATMALTTYLNSTVRVPKMDHVIVPNYISKALENWGLIIYKKDAVPFDNYSDRINSKIANVMTVTHELSHQWFGNLISPVSWKYYWMSEGMATYLKFVITDQLFKDWRLMDSMIDQQIFSFSMDDSTTAVHINADIVYYISQQKRSFVYVKPSLIFWMLEHMIGKDTFQTGLLNFINTHEYSSVTSDDLWEAMQNALNRSDSPHLEFQVKDVMDTWINQIGYPLVTVTRNYTTGDAIIRQELSIFGADKTRKQWWIPINYATKSKPDFSITKPTYFLKPNDESIVIEGIDINDWIIVNLQQTGYYRVNYDIENWKKTANDLNTGDYKKMHVRNRIQLIDTAFHLIERNQLNPEIFIELTNYLRREVDSAVWNYVFSMLTKIEKYIQSPRGGKVLKAHILDLMEALLETIDYDKLLSIAGDEFNKQTKIQAATLACKLGNLKCKTKAASQLHAYLKDPEANRVPADAEYWVFCIGLMNANQSIWDRLCETQIRNDQENFRTTLNYLSCTENFDIIMNYLNMTLTENATTLQFARPIDILLEINLDIPTNVDALIDFLLNNFETIRTVIDRPEVILDNLIWKITRQDQLNKLKNFLKISGINRNSDIYYRECALKKIDKKVTEILHWLKYKETSKSEQNMVIS